MASPRVFTPRGPVSTWSIQGGFTLMELLIVIGLLLMLAGLSLFLDFNSFRAEAFRAETGSLVTALQTARADALNNINQSRHGVAIHPGGLNGYVIFEGDSYASADHARDVEIKTGYDVTFTPASPTEVVFDQLSGNANFDGDLILIDPQTNKQGAISINHEGRISW